MIKHFILNGLTAAFASLFLLSPCSPASAESAGDVQKQTAYLKGRVAEEVKMARDPRRKLEIIRNDDNWWKWQADRCAYHARDAQACVSQTLELRRAVIDAKDDGAPIESGRNDVGNYSFTRNPPEGWWGLVLWSVVKRPADTSFRSKILIDKAGNPKILTMSGFRDGATWDNDDAALVDAFSRHVEQTYATAPELWGALKSQQQAWVRFGLTPLPDARDDLRISSKLDVFDGPPMCMDLLSSDAIYWLHDVNEKMNEGRLWPEVGVLPGAHVFERFAKQETNHFNGKCDQETGSTLTADFLPMRIEFWGRFPDSTILAALISYRPHHEGEKYLVRFRPDLTSPFFYGWRGLFVIPDTILPVTYRDEAAASKIIDPLLDAAAKQQE